MAQAKAKEAVTLFGDEVSFAQWGFLGRTWAPKGKQPTIKTSGKRKGLKILGVIEFKSGNFIYQGCDGKFNGQSYIEFLEQVLGQYSCPVILIEDGAPYHRSAAVKQFKVDKKNEGKLFSYGLPSYSPDKNPIEKLWKNSKRSPPLPSGGRPANKDKNQPQKALLILCLLCLLCFLWLFPWATRGGA